MTLPHRPSALRDRLDGPHPPRAADPSAWVSISAYARLYGLTRNTVYKLLAAHLLDVYQLVGVVDVIRIRNVSPDQHRVRESTNGR